MKYLLGFLALIFVIVFSAILNGYALSVLWGWFVSPYFGLSSLSIPYAIGFSLIVSYLTYQGNDRGEEDFVDIIAKTFGKALLKPAIALTFGWVVTLFI